MRRLALASLTATLAVSPALAAKPKVVPQYEGQVLQMSKDAIALRSVAGPGNKTPEVAQQFRAALLAGGWADSDIEIVPLGDTAYLIATWKGSDPGLKPIVLSSHMDVVEAKPADWVRDPFTPIVENGMLYGRGASDTKFDAVLALVSAVALRQSGFRPKRSVVIAYSGDEETEMRTSQIIAQRLKDAHLVLNADGGAGTFDEKTGQPEYWAWQGAEKTYADYQLEVTNPGGHSSTPRPDNAIAQLAAAVGKIAAYKFAPEINDITRGYFTKAAALQSDPKLAAAMRAFAANPEDPEALAVLRADPSFVGKVGTTCVPTMIAGGHATNALPQRATANVNCRIFPGHSKDAIMAELQRVVGDPAVKWSEPSADDSVASPASPMNPALVASFEKALAASWGKVPVFPAMASGASDSMWYRTLGVPSYAASPSFSKNSDDYAHGLNERVSLANIKPGLAFYVTLLSDLAAK